MAVKLTVDLSGPFFQRQPGKTLRQNVRRMMEGVAREGQRTVQAAWPVRSGAGRRGTLGRVDSLAGKPWLATAVVSATHRYPWPNAGQKRYLGGKAEVRHGMFRRTASALRSSRAVLTANLTKGIE